MSPVFLIAVFLVAGVALAVFGVRAARQRRAALAAWCATRGWAFREERDDALEERYPEFPCLRQGSGRYAYNVMEGSVAGSPGAAGAAGADPEDASPARGRRVCAFDYHYATHSRSAKGHRRTHHHHFSAVMLECSLPLKALHLRPESVLDRVGEFFGLDDIDFESVEFSRAFHVQAEDRRWAFDVLQQSTMEFLLESPRFRLQLQHGRILAWRDTTFRVEDFEAALVVCTGLLDRLPTYLLREWKGAD